MEHQGIRSLRANHSENTRQIVNISGKQEDQDKSIQELFKRLDLVLKDLDDLKEEHEKLKQQFDDLLNS